MWLHVRLKHRSCKFRAKRKVLRFVWRCVCWPHQGDRLALEIRIKLLCESVHNRFACGAMARMTPAQIVQSVECERLLGRLTKQGVLNSIRDLSPIRVSSKG
jgi:hypothetical protein